LQDVERTSGRDSLRLSNPLLNLGIIARERGHFEQALAYL
jgi:hypothetical protein